MPQKIRNFCMREWGGGNGVSGCLLGAWGDGMGFGEVCTLVFRLPWGDGMVVALRKFVNGNLCEILVAA